VISGGLIPETLQRFFSNLRIARYQSPLSFETTFYRILRYMAGIGIVNNPDPEDQALSSPGRGGVYR
jgi:hypothetical protein